MKRIFAAVIIALGISATAFAADPITKVDFKTLINFETTFLGAEKVEWIVKDEYVKANFVLAGSEMEAYFDLCGELMGTTKSVSRQELPISAKRKINKQYDDYLVKEIVEFNGTDNSRCFYMSLENDTEKVILKIEVTGEVTVAQSVKK